ncbi:SPOR domain-containing protein [Helicobacter apodemus]|uniref:SPOR domain-containing protein n=1 Tax=Helicobacter apodemus TaxID=135569 RepID=A0A2U8FFP4_9HELI|nr:SPOR domain-containing protein [Helicobacter apodemus]AWI34876.1 SPOR domain-containing protein [Helicobacter apodemus]
MTELKQEKQEKKELELDDLLLTDLEDEENKESQSKKAILLVAIGIIIFAIVVFIVYILQSDTKNKPQNIETQKPLENIERSAVQQTTRISQDFGQVPIQQQTTNSDEQFQRIIDQIKAQQKEQQVLPPLPQNPPQDPTPPKIEKPQDPTPPRSPTKPEETSANTSKNIQTNDTQLQGGEAIQGFYIQVGAFKGSPNQQVLSVIKEANLKYRMQKAGNTNRLLIGPFNNRQEAQNHLGEVRERINKEAFIKQIQ